MSSYAWSLRCRAQHKTARAMRANMNTLVDALITNQSQQPLRSRTATHELMNKTTLYTNEAVTRVMDKSLALHNHTKSKGIENGNDNVE